MNYRQTLNIFYILILGIYIIGVESFTPKGRIGHSSILTGTKLYFFGGVISDSIDTIHSNEVFYLDVSQTFTMTSPPWTDLTIAKIPFGSSWAGMSLVDINDDPTVYLFGGFMQDPVSRNDSFVSNVFTFNVKTSEWKIPYINGKIPARRRAIHAVSDNKGKVYIFGGNSDSLVGSPTIQFFNDMVILNTTCSTWYGSTLNAPIKRNAYSATILEDGVIVYIGGIEFANDHASVVNINEINLYDTNFDTWSVMNTKNTSIIESRFYHSAALAPDGNIIIYGGAKYSSIVPKTLISVEPDIAILRTQNTPFEWIIPTISSNIGKMPSIYAHTANLVENYMIVAFGKYLLNTNMIISNYCTNVGLILPSDMMNANYNSKIYIMDIRNYTWVDTFNKKLLMSSGNNLSSAQTLTRTPPDSEDNIDSSMKIVIGVLSGVVGIISLSSIGFLGYKWYKKREVKQEFLDMHKEFRIL